MNVSLSPYGFSSTEPSPVNRMMTAFAGDYRDGFDINLGIGYVNEKTIPADLLTQAMRAVASDPATYRQAFNYGGPAGSPNLICSIRDFLLGHHIGGLDAATLDRLQLIIGPCGATSILDALAEVLAPGIVVTSDPNYYIYSDTLERKGFRILAVPEDSEGPRLDTLEQKLDALGGGVNDISFFYAVTVNNPSCTILSNPRRRALLDVASRLSRRQNRRIPIFYDLAYELLLHDPAAPPFRSVLPDDGLGIAYEIGTLSKVLAPGLRIGYLLGPGGPFMNAMVQKTSDTGFSAPLFVQEMASYLLDHHIADQLRAVNAGYREKALAVRAGIEQHLGPHLDACIGGSAGFYFYLTFKETRTEPGSPFFNRLAHPANSTLPKVIYVPGQYCVHPRGDLAELGLRQLRLSYGFEDTPRILHALSLMRGAIAE
ncbi:MAG: pyridoxal phosphate-dependent aminotransferase [Candidatus Solibacter usitatus]|nr:pyridoxal phosphate-dependent aminotransferase [Candidatus Solibacter usitatus]